MTEEQTKILLTEYPGISTLFEPIVGPNKTGTCRSVSDSSSQNVFSFSNKCSVDSFLRPFLQSLDEGVFIPNSQEYPIFRPIRLHTHFH